MTNPNDARTAPATIHAGAFREIRSPSANRYVSYCTSLALFDTTAGNRRLSESFALLSDAASTLSIGGIAETLCFADASSFSRAFRREFGMSPSDVRGGLRPTASATKGEHDIHTFADCLRFF